MEHKALAGCEQFCQLSEHKPESRGTGGNYREARLNSKVHRAVSEQAKGSQRSSPFVPPQPYGVPMGGRALAAEQREMGGNSHLEELRVPLGNDIQVVGVRHYPIDVHKHA